MSNKNNKKNTRLHTIKSKLKVIAYSERYNKTEAAKHFDIPRTTINDWIKNKSKFLALPKNKLNKTSLHPGREQMFPQLEKDLLIFIEFNRKLFKEITTYSILIKMFELCPFKKDLPLKQIMNIFINFLKETDIPLEIKLIMGNYYLITVSIWLHYF